MKQRLWTRNFTLLTSATVLGCIGGIAGSFALSFLVYDETGSTLAAAILIAIQVIPEFFVPLIAAPIMDRLPRKPFLVGGDIVNGILYTLAGLYLLNFSFSYVGYLFFSLFLYSLSSFDSLAFNSIYPKLIPKGSEEKGYTVSSMVYPVMKVIMMPLAAVLLETIGVAAILLIQGGMCLLSAAVESRIKIQEESRMNGERFSFKMWRRDIRKAVDYIKEEKGLQSIYAYMAVTNGVGNGYSPILIAFFRTMPGFTVAMYSFFTVAEFAGRSLGGLFRYHVKIPENKRFSFAFFVYQAYECMDMILLWLPYPLMLVNRAICGFLGINSAALRQAAVQRHIPEGYRARINAFETVVISMAYSLFGLLIGAMGEWLDLRVCLSLCGGFTAVVCFATIWRGRARVRAIYNAPITPFGGEGEAQEHREEDGEGDRESCWEDAQVIAQVATQAEALAEVPVESRGDALADI